MKSTTRYIIIKVIPEVLGNYTQIEEFTKYGEAIDRLKELQREDDERKSSLYESVSFVECRLLQQFFDISDKRRKI